MTDTAVSPELLPEPSFDDALAFVREHAGDARLVSGESLVGSRGGHGAHRAVAQYRSARGRGGGAVHTGAASRRSGGAHRRALRAGGARARLRCQEARAARLGQFACNPGGAARNRPRCAGGAPRAGRGAAQDVARVRAGHPRRADPARVAGADAALLRGAQDGAVAGRAARDARNLRAARQSSRHLATEVGARGPRVPLRRPDHLQAHREAARREAHRARVICDERDRPAADRTRDRAGSRPR